MQRWKTNEFLTKRHEVSPDTMNAYEGFPNLQRISIVERIQIFAENTLEEIQRGTSISEIKALIPELIDEEKYELVEGIKIAVQKFEEKPQLALF